MAGGRRASAAGSLRIQSPWWRGVPGTRPARSRRPRPGAPPAAADVPDRQSGQPYTGLPPTPAGRRPSLAARLRRSRLQRMNAGRRSVELPSIWSGCPTESPGESRASDPRLRVPEGARMGALLRVLLRLLLLAHAEPTTGMDTPRGVLVLLGLLARREVAPPQDSSFGILLGRRFLTLGEAAGLDRRVRFVLVHGVPFRAWLETVVWAGIARPRLRHELHGRVTG